MKEYYRVPVRGVPFHSVVKYYGGLCHSKKIRGVEKRGGDEKYRERTREEARGGVHSFPYANSWIRPCI